MRTHGRYVGLHTGRQLFVPHEPGGAPPWLSEARVNVVLLVAYAGVRVATFTLIYNGLLGIGVTLDNPLGDDAGDLPGLAYQVYMKREAEAFGLGVDAIDPDGSRSGHVWWEGLAKAEEEGRAPAHSRPKARPSK